MSEEPERVVVVGVDGSDHSQRALHWADYMARQAGATVRAVTAWSTPTQGLYGGYPSNYNPAADAKSILEEAVRKAYSASGPARLETRVVQNGSAARALLDEAEGAYLVVVGSRGHGGFAGLLLGSVSATVAEHATCPVLVVHDTEPPL